MTVSPAGLRLRRRRLRRLLRILMTIQLVFTIGFYALLVQIGREQRDLPALASGILVALLLLPPALWRWLGPLNWIYLPLLFVLDISHITLLLWSQPPAELARGSLWTLAIIPMLLLAGRWWSYPGALPLLAVVIAVDAVVLFLRVPPQDPVPVFIYQSVIATLGAVLSSGSEARVRRDLALREALSLSEERLQLSNHMHERMASQLVELRELLASAAGSAGPALQPPLQAAMQLAEKLHVAVQRSLPRVRPTPLGERTLPEVLARETETLCREMEIKCHFRFSGHLPLLRPAAAEYLFRAALEALSNVRTHAAARNVTVDLDHDEDTVVLHVIDDGVGFDASGALSSHNTAWGLLSMRPRLEELGGSLTVVSSPGAGTQVEVRLPVARW